MGVLVFLKKRQRGWIFHRKQPTPHEFFKLSNSRSLMIKLVTDGFIDFQITKVSQL